MRMLCYINTWTKIFGADLTANRWHFSASLLSCNYDTLFEKITVDSDLSSLLDLRRIILIYFVHLYIYLFILLLLFNLSADRPIEYQKLGV